MNKAPATRFDLGLTVNKHGKPALDCQFAVPRLLNTDASLSIDASVSSLIAHALNIKYSLPFGRTSSFHAEAVKQSNDYSFASSFTEAVSGFRLAYSFKRNHIVGFDAHLRDVFPVISGTKLLASEQIRRVPLRTIKTGLNYRYMYDTTQPDGLGGSKFSFLSDLCGLFGDVSFFKLDSVYWHNKRIGQTSFAWHSRIGAGAIAQLRSGRGVSTPIQDRFFLGGTNEETSCFRGFAMRSMGPAGKRISAVTNPKKGDKLYDHLGGDAYFSLDNALSFPLYYKDGLKIRGMVFGQIGSLVSSLNARTPHDLVRNIRVSIGAGVFVPIGNVGRLELTLGKSVLGMINSDYQQMLQIGIRISNRV
jgi:outer membrane protein assembly factor BamA